MGGVCCTLEKRIVYERYYILIRWNIIVLEAIKLADVQIFDHCVHTLAGLINVSGEYNYPFTTILNLRNFLIRSLATKCSDILKISSLSLLYACFALPKGASIILKVF